jgi:hypothetical protein
MSAAAGASAAAGSGATAGTSATAGASAAAGGGALGGAGGAIAGSAGAGGGSMAAGGAGGTTMHEDLGKGDGSDVVMLGDSWMSNTLQIEGTGGGISPALQAESKQPYRNYAVQGVMLLQADSFGPAIPTQWDDAVRVNKNIKTVVITGGGNDIIQGSPTLQSSCSAGTDECKMTLKKISDTFDALFTKMAEAGVQDIVHIKYADELTGTLDPSLRGTMGTPIPQSCLSGKIRCHGVETNMLVGMGGLAADGIHPLQAANQRIAKAVFELMTKEGIRR